MKKIILYVFIFFIFSLLFKYFFEHTMNGIDQNNRTVQTFFIGRIRYDISNLLSWRLFEGEIRIYYRKSKKLKGQSYYKDGLLSGIRKYWYENGYLKEEIPFKDGLANGTRVHWSQNGIKTAKINYKNGKLEGYSYSWFENGIEREVRFYKNGKQEKISVDIDNHK